MSDELGSGLKNLFLIHGIAGVVFGLAYFLAPGPVGDLYGVAITDEAPYRLVGAAMLGFGASSFLAWKSDSWAASAIIVQMEVVWTALGTVATIWGILSGELPALVWANAVLLAAFCGAFAMFWMKRRG